MSVISKRFADELSDKRMRKAYLSAQTRTKLASQIRALRQQRKWTQGQLGEKLGGVPQGNVSRLEDRSYGKQRLETLFELAAAFDVGLVVEFVNYRDFLLRTQSLSPQNLEVPEFTRRSLDLLCGGTTGRQDTSSQSIVLATETTDRTTTPTYLAESPHKVAIPYFAKEI